MISGILEKRESGDELFLDYLFEGLALPWNSEFSRRQTMIFFLYYVPEIGIGFDISDLPFHANCLLRRQFACNDKSFFFWEK